MRITRKQLKNLIVEMFDDGYGVPGAAGEQLAEYVMFVTGWSDGGEIDQFFQHLGMAGPIAGLYQMEKLMGRKLTFDEVNQLIDLLSKDGWFQP